MEDSTSVLTENGRLLVKMENPSSPLNALNHSHVISCAVKKRKPHRRPQNDSSVLEELNKLLVETSVSLALTSMNQPPSQPCQTQAKMTGVGGIQTTALPTSVSYSCPIVVQTNQISTLASESHPLSLSTSQSASTATVSKINAPPSVAPQSRTRNKLTENSKNSDEPKIVIIEEPEEVFYIHI